MMTVEQCRAARSLLGWSAQELADQAGIGVATVRRYEGGNQIADISLEALSGALASAGVTLIGAGQKSTSGGVGVRLTKGVGG
ncbi:helix-turn-helix transcriptional regulator [Sphingomonas sp. GM_Shp_1]|jgi:transcriptional regulator with XRE-family HTH domain|uniref:helix-turn-helix domain-containing protein n=1 Tax=Sphingomonas sp. GM_Shp_1 TaxID=2937381 RepID=UPI00226B7402|nr:helix-turn-helix transcriptional regulator [Sphingomonas sp. GM_Shp_1]